MASPAPNKKRALTRTKNANANLADTNAVSVVKTPHHNAPAVRTRRGPKRSAK